MKLEKIGNPSYRITLSREEAVALEGWLNGKLTGEGGRGTMTPGRKIASDLYYELPSGEDDES